MPKKEKLIHRIVFATDFSACSFKAFGYALAWAKFFEARLAIVHVVRNYASLDIDEAIVYVNIEEQIQGARERLEKYGLMGEILCSQYAIRAVIGNSR